MSSLPNTPPSSKAAIDPHPLAPPPPASSTEPAVTIVGPNLDFSSLQRPAFRLLSILIPVYNEERYLAAVIKRVAEDQATP